MIVMVMMSAARKLGLTNRLLVVLNRLFQDSDFWPTTMVTRSLIDPLGALIIRSMVNLKKKKRRSTTSKHSTLLTQPESLTSFKPTALQTPFLFCLVLLLKNCGLLRNVYKTLTKQNHSNLVLPTRPFSEVDFIDGLSKA